MGHVRILDSPRANVGPVADTRNAGEGSAKVPDRVFSNAS
jgi:hypothetical protein